LPARSGGGAAGQGYGDRVRWNGFQLPGGVMRVVVDFDLCESNAVCMGVAPEVFEVRDDDFLYVLQEEPDESLRPKVEEAVRRCPKQAISLEG
jgi:ferredoxin